MGIKLDAETEEYIEAYKRARQNRRQLIMQMLREMGLDVQNWEEARLCVRALLGR